MRASFLQTLNSVAFMFPWRNGAHPFFQNNNAHPPIKRNKTKQNTEEEARVRAPRVNSNGVDRSSITEKKRSVGDTVVFSRVERCCCGVLLPIAAAAAAVALLLLGSRFTDFVVMRHGRLFWCVRGAARPLLTLRVLLWRPARSHLRLLS